MRFTVRMIKVPIISVYIVNSQEFSIAQTTTERWLDLVVHNQMHGILKENKNKKVNQRSPLTMLHATGANQGADKFEQIAKYNK